MQTAIQENVSAAAPASLLDAEAWNREINDAVSDRDAARSNRKITSLHYRLSQALGEVIGTDVGANFHTWAVWGSSKAGVTIRQEDRDQASRDGAIAGQIIGALFGVLLAGLLHGWSTWIPMLAWGTLGLVCGGLTGGLIIHRSRVIAAQLILHGNRIVLDEIGRQSARFISMFRHASEPNPAELDRFLADLRPGHSTDEGQDLLSQAFALYWRAKYARTEKEKHEAAYFANCLAVLHEHYRLQPLIKGSLPWIISKCVTQRLMQFDVGPVTLAVSHDVPSLDGMPYPATLMELTDAELIQFLRGPEGWDAAGSPLEGTGAQDWTDLRQRMRYIVNLFRVLHLSPCVWQSPLATE